MEDESPVKKYRSLAEIMRVTAPYDDDGASNEKSPTFKVREYGEKLKGIGMPYALENWPNQGDKWSWKTGIRISPSGYYTDKYLYPPQGLPDGRRKRRVLDSIGEFGRFVTSTFPGTDIDAFYDTFTRKVPSHRIGGPQLTEGMARAEAVEDVPSAKAEVDAPRAETVEDVPTAQAEVDVPRAEAVEDVPRAPVVENVPHV